MDLEILLNHAASNKPTDELTIFQTFNHLKTDPDVWLTLLENKLLPLPDIPNKRKVLNYFFKQAQNRLDAEINKHSESLGKIYVHEALFFARTNVSDARDVFEDATMTLRRVPYVHLAFAQFEVNQRRRNKALKILQLGLKLTQSDSLTDAISRLDAGENEIFSAGKVYHTPSRSTTNSIVRDNNFILCRHQLSGSHSHSTYNVKTLKSLRHTMAEALDLPCSPCTPYLNSKIKPGLMKTPMQKIKSHNMTVNIATPKTPVLERYSLSLNKPLSCQLSFGSDRLHQSHSSTKTTKDLCDDLEEWADTAHCLDCEKAKVIVVNKRKYDLMKELAVGGSIKVYEVFDVANRTVRALKQVRLKGCDKSVRDGFVNEIKFLQRLKGNENIVELQDYELTDSYLFMVMERGSTDLARYIRQRKNPESSLKPYEIVYYWKRMLDTVKTIHDQGIIHLDLKPANFLFVEGNLKLIYFGIANSLQADSTSVIKDTQFGTLSYMAPEAILDMSGGFQSSAPKFKISPRTDVWSLGCILHLMMYGRTPFQHITHQAMKLNAIINPACKIEFEDFPDRQLLATVESCLRRDPKQRPTVEQLMRC